jgi:catechol 2,3-dioxygenase-like lactoylglutathione lyase family enzyme
VRVHHSAVCTADIEASLRFWRDGLGFSVLMDQEFEGDWPTLFGAASTRLRSIFLGDADHPDHGIVELVEFDDLDGAAPLAARPATGFLLLSVFTEVAKTLARLDDLGMGGAPTEITTSGVRMAVVRDPNGVLVELIDLA